MGLERNGLETNSEFVVDPLRSSSLSLPGYTVVCASDDLISDA